MVPPTWPTFVGLESTVCLASWPLLTSESLVIRMKTHPDFAKYPLGVETASQSDSEEKRRENELDTRRQAAGPSAEICVWS